MTYSKKYALPMQTSREYIYWLSTKLYWRIVSCKTTAKIEIGAIKEFWSVFFSTWKQHIKDKVQQNETDKGRDHRET
jgi:hypothetical protein